MVSPDLNPIEQVWDMLDRRVRARARAIPARNVWEIAGVLVEEFGLELTARTVKSGTGHEEEMHCST